MQEYELRFHKAGGALSVVMKTSAPSDSEMRRSAAQMLVGNIESITLFDADHEIGTVQRRKDVT